MFRHRYNELRLTLQLAPAGPLLVKEGRHTKQQRSFHRGVTRDPPRPRRRDGPGYGSYDSEEGAFDMACVWTQTAAGPRFYLPGSSVRGVLRSAAERLIGRWQPAWVRASEPFQNQAQHWVLAQRDAERVLEGADIYRMCGPIERCFGHTALRGRWRIGDAWMVNERAAQVVVRDGVGIDRRTGAAANNVKFQFEAITGGVFETTMTLVNYELWQPGLLAHLLAAIDAGDIRLGYGTRRGLGHVRLAVPAVTFVWYGAVPTQENDGVRLPTLAALVGEDSAKYGLRDAGCTIVVPLQPDEDALIGSVWRAEPPRAAALPDNDFQPTDWDAPFWAALAAPLDAVLAAWALPAEFQPSTPAQEETPS